MFNERVSLYVMKTAVLDAFIADFYVSNKVNFQNLSISLSRKAYSYKLFHKTPSRSI